MNDPTAHKLGDRHLRPIDGLARPSGQRRVRITAGDAAARSVAGQHTLWMLANLLARQFGVIAEIELALPRVPLHARVALFGGRGSLPDSLAEVIRMVAGTAVRVTDVPAQADVEVVVGRPWGEQLPSTHRIAVAGSGWRVFAGGPDAVPEVNLDDANTLAPYFAACIIGGEVFKRLCGLQPGKGRFIDALTLSLWDFHPHTDWYQAPDGPPIDTVALPPFYLVGAGAVGQAAAAALAAWDALRGHVTIIDLEGIDETNLNRYPLATLADVGAMKTELLTKYLADRGFTVHRSDNGWPGYALDPLARSKQRPDLQTEEAAYRYRLVLSCVDKNVPRHAIQSYSPEYLIGASTNGLGLAVAAYDMRSDFECLKCHNPPEPKGPAVEEIAEQLRRLPKDERRRRAEACGADWKAVEQYITDPRCGKLGEAEMEKFTAGSPDWSVGFVSTASGTLLAAQLVKFALLGRQAFPESEGNTLRFNFLNPGLRWSKHRRNPACDCIAEGRRRYLRLWEV
ncbi:MAG TPA: ThiF family adenylyltransferase [Tepidisphaeraceae bacterium]|nr:ThiF family adenylyltransferase [Tepidisphaeraceae bacterium]